MADWLMAVLDGIPLNMRILIAAGLPVTELRAAIPVGIALGIGPLEAFFLGVLGNLIPVVPLLLIIPRIYRWLGSRPSFRNYLQQVIEKTRRKGSQVEKYGALGLLLFVAVPLPGTGVWTGSLLAFIMGINLWYSIVALSGGAVLAGIAVTIASIGLLQAFKFVYGLELLGIAALAAIVCWWLIKKWKRNR